MQTKRITVLLADDHSIARNGIRNMLEQTGDITVIGEAQNGKEALRLVAKLKPQVLLLDLVMPGPRPAEIEEAVRTKHPETSTLVLTSHDRDAYLADMIHAGASGYLNKNITAERLIGAIRRAAKGEILFDEEQYLRAEEWQKSIGEKLAQLTKREIEIMKLLSKGLDNKTLAAALGISSKTVAFHITNILTKLQVKSRQEAALWGLQNLPDNLE
ncbi:MAG: response regulator transcription factor [Anaerolineales bacterium]|nr:response regulator transcription factor [Anaerolineales bacterium]MCZ2121401.1 response regulator transcription factor [Anaerolineales bacterium]